ncbi:hypothetical protein GGI15_003590 [Coemansia interrupta]|uniref:Zn(2)-C6 fungal-type domain-containing protein n=1 Tax=Coemansia interrupta TaxID=1126814 RepID=A0A9W8HF12_9FUNG|nr:hypothetical protein GGI15_003590 [Coemansia interrupta]
MAHHYHPNTVARTDMRYWPYPQQFNMPLGSPPAGYAYYGHPPLPPPPPPIPVSTGPLSTSTTPWRRERRSKACFRCHTKKIKCEGEGPVCDGCRQAGCECKWVEMKKRGPKPKPKAKLRRNNGEVRTDNGSKPDNDAERTLISAEATAAPAAASVAADHSKAPAYGSGPRRPEDNAAGAENKAERTLRLSPAASGMDEVLQRFFSPEVAEDTRDAVISFFDYFYGRIPIFHPASFVRRIVANDVDELLVDTMKAYTARAVMRKTGRAIDIEGLTTSVRRRLLTGLDRPTIDYVRAVVLASALSGGESKFTSYNSLTCLASSLVTRLGWHTLDLDLESDAEDVSWEAWVELEIKRRTFWAVYQLDSYHGLIADRPLTIDPARIFIATPGSDHTWDDITVPQILHWPTRHNPGIARDTIIRTAALSYTFIELCNVMHIVGQMNDFLWSVKLTISARLRGAARTPDIPFLRLPATPQLQPLGGEPVASLFDYPEFRRIHEAFLGWRDRLVPAETIDASSCAALTDFARFGSAENRRFTMRVRYFCLRCYHTAIFLLLHFANRPSFFDPATNQQQARLRRAQQDARSREHSVASGGSTPQPFCDEDSVLRNLMSAAFSEMLNDGYMADDVVEESWDICLEEVFLLVEHLDRNSDIPIDRYDASISFCLFTGITVLIRHIKKCRHKLSAKTDKDGEKDDPGADALRQTLSKHTSVLRRLWTMLKELGFIWTVKGMEQLLRSMQIDEIANAADLFSSLSL